MKTALLKAFFLTGLAAGLLMALIPNTHGDRHNFLPAPFRAWMNENDDFENIAAFLLISAVALRLPGVLSKGGTLVPAMMLQILNRPVARVAALMLLVCAIEITQLFIPGRVADFQDVCTGWSGILAGWLLSVLLDARAAESADVKIRTD